jgi:choline dehydrogenase
MNNSGFDYIIIGAGSAGCVLANRLSANGKHTVCLLEAGPEDRTPFAKIPGAFAYFMFSKKYNWGYHAKADSSIRNGQPLFVPRGKALGGSSTTNAMVYIRGQKQDYDDWEKVGNSGWSYDKLLPYFKKSESNERGEDEFHGVSGPVHVGDSALHYSSSKSFLEAAVQAGFNENPDFNGSEQEGVGAWQRTIKNGIRCSSATAYLNPAKQRENLTIITSALVEHIVLEKKAAIGASYRHNGKQKTITAAKEVIVCGGAINSPQLLMLSGIGSREDLEPHGIICKHELPGVGKNLQEHVDACVLVNSRRSDGLATSPLGLLKILPAALKYIFKKQGKLTSVIIEAGGFVKSQAHLERPDIQLGLVPLLFDDSGRDLKLMRDHGYSCHVSILRPKSRGKITLSTALASDAPVIDFNFFSHPDDKKKIIDGIKLARKILAAPAFDNRRGEEIHPGKDAQSDEAIFKKCKERLGTVFHPVGTCRMGQDSMAVVDRHLKVHGIENLRVIDASIMPSLISGNTNAPTIAIAEYAADIVLGDT